MILLLPRERHGLRDLEDRLTVQTLAAWTADLNTREHDVYLPRFRVEQKSLLNGVLAGMGMPSAFADGAADFSAMNGRRNLIIQAVIHQAFVEVNEEGTEAAAATGVSMGETSMPPTFRADHPFLFLIRDNLTRSVLFLGRLADPSV